MERQQTPEQPPDQTSKRSPDNSLAGLQTVLRGEYMAIGVYTAVLDTVTDPAVQRHLETVRNDHQRHAEELAQQIAELGGKPLDGAGISGWAARAGIRVRGWFQEDPRGILRQVYDGEDLGIAAAANIAENSLAGECRALVERIVHEDRGHLSQLEAVIAQQTGDS